MKARGQPSAGQNRPSAVNEQDALSLTLRGLEFAWKHRDQRPLALEDEPMEELLVHSITYRIAVGPRAGRKVFTLQTLPAGDEPSGEAAGQAGGFSLHAGVAARAEERAKLERLCRYISRPAVSEQRLSLTPGGHTRYELKTPSQDGTTHPFEPLDFLARLAGWCRDRE